MSAESRDRTSGRGSGPRKPGDHLRAELARLGLDQGAVSKATGVSRQSINNIVNGRQPISRVMAARLGRLTGHSSDYWLQASFGGGVDRTTTAGPRGGVLVNHQIARAVRDGVIGITGFDETNMRPAALDLTFGAVAAPRRNASARSIRLARGRSVRIVTGERLAFPLDHLGRIGAAPHLARLGGIASHALQVDPGFSGALEVCIFNAGDGDILLRLGDPVLSLEIVPLGALPTPLPKPAPGDK
jgi:addiction module HigA family antidote